MQGDLFKIPLEIYYKSLEQINGVKLTSREIDVVACIISGRAATKTIASFLSIESKTVEVHTRNIRLKLACNSREGIVQFIEKAGKFSAARHHYLLLLIQSAFEQKLQQVSALVIQKKIFCLVLYEQQYENFISQLRKYFKRLGVEGVFRAKETDKRLKDSLQDFDLHSFAHCLFVTSSLQLKQVLRKESLEDTTLSQVLQHSEAITFISLREESKEVSQEKDEIDCTDHISFGNDEQYYLSFFDLFKRLFPEAALDKLIFEFKQQCDILTNNPSGKSSLILAVEGKDLESRKHISHHLFVSFLKKGAGRLLISSVLCLSIFCIVILIFKSNKPDPSLPLHQVQKSKAIRSDLSLLHDMVLLKRPEIMKQIKEKLKGDQGIQTVALVGIGGAGKTTIARHYAHQQNANVIWEVNAETKESLISSFENLAYAITQTENEKRILVELKNIENFDEKLQKLLFFTREKLSIYSNWFLIYDNVEKFSDIQKYFPTDTKVWGNGKIILTTKNSNIKNNNYINNIIYIEELTFDQKLNLFFKIMNQEEKVPYNSTQIKETKNFIKELPPFPLDISIAAYYLKATNISYIEYLENLIKYSKDFENIKENLIKEAGDYTKTRYSIIKSSIQNLINTNQDFYNLLLFVSLIDSQNIPINLLRSYKNHFVVDDFIYSLKRYSLISNETYHNVHLIPSFSMHRSIQKICLAYFSDNLDLPKKRQITISILNIIENYISDLINKEDISQIKILINHCEIFVKNIYFLNDDTKILIKSKLGIIYYYLKYYKKAELFLKEALINIKKYQSKHYKSFTEILIHLGNVYVELGIYDKAKELFEQNIIVYEEYFLKNPVEAARVSAQLGNVYRRLGNYEKAKTLLEHCLTIYDKHFYKNYAEVAQTLAYLGIIYKKFGNHDKAKDLIEQSITICKEYFSDDHVKTAWILSEAGTIYLEIGDYKKAKNLLEQCLVIYRKHFSEDHVDVAQALVHLGNVYAELGEYKNAKYLLEKGLMIYKKKFSNNHIRVAWILAYLGPIYNKLGYYQQSEIILKKSLKIHKMHFKDTHVKIGFILLNLGNVYKKIGRYEKAKILFEESFTIYEKNYGKNSIEICPILKNLGESNFFLGQIDTAEKLLKQAVDIAEQKRHHKNYIFFESLANLYLKKYLNAVREKNIKESEKFKIQSRNYFLKAKENIIFYYSINFPYLAKIQDRLKNFN